MGDLVLDCSVAMSWCFEDQATPYSESVLDLLAHQKALVPAHWPLEVTNVLLTAERKKILTEAQSARFTEILLSLPVEIDEKTSLKAFQETLSLARNHGLTSYDAAYLELAMRQGLPLATQDNALKKAAKKCGVRLV